MNKKLVALVAAAMMSISAGSVFAGENPVTFDSSLSVQYRADKAAGVADTSDTKTTFVTNASFGLTKNIDFYGRIAAQHLNNGNFTDFASHNSSTEVAFDQFGIIIKGGDNNFTYKIGRQSIGLGANETLYSSSGYYGNYTQADGITITGKSGVVDLKAIAAKEDTHPAFGGKNKIYGLEASYKPSDAWTVGATLARYDFAALDQNFNSYAVNVGYTFSPKASIMTEYAKANTDTDNKAYNAVFNYAFDNKLTGSLSYSRTEAQSTPWTSEQWTGFDLGYKGFYYGLDYKMSKDYTLSVLYKDMKTVDTDASWKSLRTTLSYKF